MNGSSSTGSISSRKRVRAVMALKSVPTARTRINCRAGKRRERAARRGLQLCHV